MLIKRKVKTSTASTAIRYKFGSQTRYIGSVEERNAYISRCAEFVEPRSYPLGLQQTPRDGQSIRLFLYGKPNFRPFETGPNFEDMFICESVGEERDRISLKISSLEFRHGQPFRGRSALEALITSWNHSWYSFNDWVVKLLLGLRHLERA